MTVNEHAYNAWLGSGRGQRTGSCSTSLVAQLLASPPAGRHMRGEPLCVHASTRFFTALAVLKGVRCSEQGGVGAPPLRS